MPYTGSESTEATLTLQGVWMHDPRDPAGTAVSFPYGADARETEVDAMGAGTFYAGRAAPVFDFGEHEGRVVGVTIEVPSGSTYQSQLSTLESFATLKRPVWFRDNRGRAVHGVVQGFRHNDAAHGSTVSFSVEEAHLDVEEVA